MADNFDWEKVCVSKFCTVCADFVNYEKQGQETGFFTIIKISLSKLFGFGYHATKRKMISFEGYESMSSLTPTITLL